MGVGLGLAIHESAFEPLPTDNINDPIKLQGCTENDKKLLAEKLYITRMKKMAERLPKDPVSIAYETLCTQERIQLSREHTKKDK